MGSARAFENHIGWPAQHHREILRQCFGQLTLPQFVDGSGLEYHRSAMAKSKMPNRSKRYPPEFHRQLVELHRAGRRISELAREFGVSEWAISRWVKQADRDVGRGDGGLTTAEREELVR